MRIPTKGVCRPDIDLVTDLLDRKAFKTVKRNETMTVFLIKKLILKKRGPGLFS